MWRVYLLRRRPLGGTWADELGNHSQLMLGVHVGIGTPAIRTGHHCAQPIMIRFGIPATARASFAFYNTKEEADALGRGLQKAIEVLS